LLLTNKFKNFQTLQLFIKERRFYSTTLSILNSKINIKLLAKKLWYRRYKKRRFWKKRKWVQFRPVYTIKYKKFQIRRNLRKKFYLTRFRRRSSRIFLFKTLHLKKLKSGKINTINKLFSFNQNYSFFFRKFYFFFNYFNILDLIANRARRYRFNNEFFFFTLHNYYNFAQYHLPSTLNAQQILLSIVSYKYNWVIKFGHLGRLLEESYTPNYPIIVISKTMSFLFNKMAYFFILKNPKKLFSTFDVLYLEHYFLNFDRRRFPFKEIFHPFEFFYLLYFTFKLVDFSWFIRRFQLILNKLYIFKHKTFFSYLFLTIATKFFYLFPEFKLEGCFLSLKGKLGVAGNSRKRRYFLNIGKTSRFFIKNKRRVYYKYYLLNTVSGAIGFKIWLFFH